MSDFREDGNFPTEPPDGKRNREDMPAPASWLDFWWRLWAFRHWAVDRYTWEAFTRSALALLIIGSALFIGIWMTVRGIETVGEGMAVGSIFTLAATVATHYFKSTD